MNNAEYVNILDVEGNVVYANKAYCKVTNYSEEQIQGKSFTSLLATSIPKALVNEIFSTLKNLNPG